MNDVLIREATVADAEAIARVHVDCWREAYAKILPAEYLNTLSWEKRAEHWHKMFQEEQTPWRVLVAEEEGNIKGFVSIGPARKSNFDIGGELYALYTLKQIQGRGVGKKLFEKARNSLALSGIMGMYLWVFKDNPALAFYKHMGGKELTRQTVNIGGVDVEEVAMTWERTDAEGK